MDSDVMSDPAFSLGEESDGYVPQKVSVQVMRIEEGEGLPVVPAVLFGCQLQWQYPKPSACVVIFVTLRIPP
ncbi:hypothetical protein E5D57_011676 [Metarhizium anisopliae]|nr:hypothetical protein E5D57_011676 [Metarhizium anisopliae]